MLISRKVPSLVSWEPFIFTVIITVLMYILFIGHEVHFYPIFLPASDIFFLLLGWDENSFSCENNASLQHQSSRFKTSNYCITEYNRKNYVNHNVYISTKMSLILAWISCFILLMNFFDQTDLIIILQIYLSCH